MVEFATQYEVDNFKEFELRLLTPLDALEFAKAQNESFEQLCNYFDAEYFSKPRPFIELFQSLMAMIRSRGMDLFGFYRSQRLLGIGIYYPLSYSDNGCHIVIWMRKSESGKGVGTYFLRRLTLYAIYEKGYHFVELLIDQSHGASRTMADKVGYEHVESFPAQTSGRMGSGIYCRYLCFDGQIDALAEEYGRRKIDLIDHPAYSKSLRGLINDERVNEAFSWNNLFNE